MIDFNSWFGRVTNGEPEEEETAVQRTLRMLQGGAETVQAGATDLYNRAAAPQTGVGEAVRSTAQSAYDALPEIRRPATELFESAQGPLAAGPGYGPQPLPEGQQPWIQSAAPVIQRGATGLYDAAQDPTNAVNTVKRAAIAGYEAGRDEYVPDTLPEIATALTMPPLHASNVAQAAYGAASGEIGRGIGRAAGTSTDPLTTIPGYGPVSSEDIASGVAQTVLDPTNFMGAGAATSAARAAPAVARTAAETAFRAGRGAVDPFGSLARSGQAVGRRAAGVADNLLSPGMAPEGEMLLGSGMVPRGEPAHVYSPTPPEGAARRYHGTAGAFDAADPAKFDENGLYGPGYYTTSDPRVAGSYADQRGMANDADQIQVSLDYAHRYIAELRRKLPDMDPGGRLARDSQTEIERLEAAIPEWESRLAEIQRAPSGPNIRAVDVPPDVRMLDADAPLTEDVLGRVNKVIDQLAKTRPDVAVEFRSELQELSGLMAQRARSADPIPTPTDFLLQRLFGAADRVSTTIGDGSYGAKGLATEILERAGFDGIAHKGGQRVPMLDDAGKPIEHDVSVIFPGSVNKVRNAFSGTQGGSGFQALLPGPGVRGQLRADAYNASQGAFMGAASESVMPQEEGAPELTPTERLARIVGGGLIGMAAGRATGRGVGNRRGRAAARLGSGYIPEPAIPRNLGDGGFVSRGPRAEAHRAAYREFLNAHKALSVARTEREKVEKFLARYPDDVEGQRRLESALAREDEAQSIAQAAEEYEQMVRTGDMSLGSGFVPASGDMDPAEAAARAQASAEAAARGAPRYRPELSAEPVLPGMEPPRRAPGDAGPDISDAPNRPRNLGDVPESQLQRPSLPGMDPLLDAPAPRSISDLADELYGPAAGGPAPVSAQRADGGQVYLPDAQPGVLGRISKALDPWFNRAGITRYAGMLSDPATHVQNVEGNLLMQLADVVETPIAATLDAARVGASRAVGRPATREVFFGETPVQLKGMVAGARESLGPALEVLKTGVREGDPSSMDRAERGFGTNIPVVAPKGSKAANIVDAAVEGPLRALAAADIIFRTTGERGHHAAETLAQATKQANRANPGAAPTAEQLKAAMHHPDVVRRTQAASSRSVLQEDRAFTTWYRDSLNKMPPAGRAVVQAAVPWLRTPYNIMAQGMGMTDVGGLVNLIRDVKAGKAPRDVQKQLARVAMGTAVGTWAAAEYADGKITGPYPTDSAEASTLPPGWRPWSRKIEAPNGETYYVSLAVLGPFAVPAVYMILRGEAIKKYGDEGAGAALGELALGLGEYAEQNTFMEGLGQISKVLDRRTGGANAEKLIESVVSSYAPHVVGGGGAGRMIQRVMGMPSRDPEGPGEAFAATFPYQDQARAAADLDPVNPRQDVLGREQSLGMGGPLGAVVRAGQEDDAPVIAAFRGANQGLPTKGPSSLTDPATKASVKLDADQRALWEREFGQSLQREWASKGYPQDAKALNAVETKARESARRAVLGR